MIASGPRINTKLAGNSARAVPRRFCPRCSTAKACLCYQLMKTLAEWTVDVLIMVASAAYTLTALCCVWTMWNLRREFSIALRSPLIGCMTGASFTLRSCSSTYVFAMNLFDWTPDQEVDLDWIPAALHVIFASATLVSTGALIGWVLRLIVMYDPNKRKRWGRLTKERRVFRFLASSYVLLEVGVWLAVWKNGMMRVQAEVMPLFDLVMIFAVLLSVFVLGGQLRVVQDISRLSKDAQHVAILTISLTVPFIATLIFPMPAVVFKYTLIFIAVFALQPVAWTITIRPVRDFLADRPDQHETLEQGNGARCGGVLLLPPWVWLMRCRVFGRCGKADGLVACTPEPMGKQQQKARHAPLSSPTSFHESPLVAVMEFIPLKEAFGEFCSRALCSESFQFLVDVAEYQSVVQGIKGDEDGNDDFETFAGIVKEYIKNNSNSEINIDHRAKRTIMDICVRSAYASLSVEDRKNVFNVAEKEIIKMLADNLLDKFKATPDYKEIEGDDLFVASARTGYTGQIMDAAGP